MSVIFSFSFLFNNLPPNRYVPRETIHRYSTLALSLHNIYSIQLIDWAASVITPVLNLLQKSPQVLDLKWESSSKSHYPHINWSSNPFNHMPIQPPRIPAPLSALWSRPFSDVYYLVEFCLLARELYKLTVCVCVWWKPHHHVDVRWPTRRDWQFTRAAAAAESADRARLRGGERGRYR